MGRLHTPLWPDRRVKPRLGTVAIDRSHHLGDVDCAIVANEGSGRPRDLARAAPVSFAGSPSWSASRSGAVLATSSGSDYIRVANRMTAVGASPQSWLFRFGPLDATSDIWFCVGDAGDVHSNPAIHGPTWAGGGQCQFYWTGAVSNVLAKWSLSGGSFVNSTLVFIYPGGVTASEVSCYQDGVRLTHAAGETDGSSLFESPYSEEDRKLMPQATSTVGGFCHWSRALSAGDALELSANPYCFFRPIVRQSFAFLGTTGGGYQLITGPLPVYRPDLV